MSFSGSRSGEGENLTKVDMATLTLEKADVPAVAGASVETVRTTAGEGAGPSATRTNTKMTTATATATPAMTTTTTTTKTPKTANANANANVNAAGAQPALATPPATATLFDSEATNLAYWTAYTHIRPHPSPIYWNLLREYHNRPDPWSSQRGSPRHALAHDIACGPGNNLPHLANFTHLVASDVSRSALLAAAHLLPPDLASRTSLLHLAAEDVASASLKDVARALVGGRTIPRGIRGTADLVHLSEAIPLMQGVRAVGSCAALLKPGGTCCVSFYGHAAFDSSARGRACQGALDKLTRCLTRYLLAAGRLDADMAAHVVVSMASKLDNIRFEGDVWEDVERHYWTGRGSLMLFALEGVEGVDSVAATEKRIVHSAEEEHPVRARLDYAEICKLLESIFVTDLGDMADAGDVRACLGRLEEEMGGRAWDVDFPSVMILARRR